MKVVVQRVLKSSVRVDNKEIACIGKGYILLVGIENHDTKDIIKRMAHKIGKLRIMSDSRGKMNHSIVDAGGEILAVSQFTLCANARKGNRPSFLSAMKPEYALPLFDYFVKELESYCTVSTGSFGNYMNVYIENDGPVTIIFDSEELFS